MASYKVSLTNPCHENWDGMDAAQQGRHCNACAKTVVDFTLMTDTQVVNYFLERSGENICGRFLSGQLETPVTPYVPVKRKINWYWNYFVGLLLLLTKTGSAKAQAKSVFMGYADVTKRSTHQPDLRKIKDSPVEDGRIRLFDKKTKPAYLGKTLAAENNCSSIENEPAIKIADTIRSASQPKPGTATTVRLGGAALTKEEPKLIFVLDGKIITNINSIDIDKIEEVTVLQAEAAIAVYGLQGRNGAIVMRTNVHNKENESSVKLYPNPVAAGNQLQVDFSSTGKAVYSIVIRNLAGQLVLSQKISVYDKQNTLTLQTAGWTPGVYTFQLVSAGNSILSGSTFVVNR